MSWAAMRRPRYNFSVAPGATHALMDLEWGHDKDKDWRTNPNLYR